MPGRLSAAGSLKLMEPAAAHPIQRAYDAAVAGDVEQLVALFAPDLEWRGLERGRWVWRRAPS